MPLNETELERRLLAWIARPDYRPVKPRLLAEQLQLPDEQRPHLKRALKRLSKLGRLEYGSNHLVQPAKTDGTQSWLTGVFHRTRAGHGFVRPTGTRPGAGRDQDIYIPRNRTRDAATGDIVMIRRQPDRRSRSGRDVGEVTEIIERETHQFVGTYFEQAGTGYVHVDGTLFAQPIYVGDPGAKGARPGDKVVLEMVRFPSPIHEGEGVITEVLGNRGAPGVDTLLVMREFDLPEEFSEEVLADARRQAERFDESIQAPRIDLTAETIITIDPVDARDFDDAISLRRMENGHWRLGVHIADVTHFVPTDSALDIEARQRATSVYLPNRVIPMLPETISNHLASLQPDQLRYTKTAFIELTEDGARVATDLVAGAIRSCRRFSYEEVDSWLQDRSAWQEKLAPDVNRLLADMHELAMKLRQRRMQLGALELSLPETELDYNAQGQVTGAHRCENTVSHQIIEEFMLAANEAVAERFQDGKWLFIRRIHESPEPRKLKALTEFVQSLMVPCDSLESRFEIQRVLRAVLGHPYEQAVHYAVLRSMQKAVYSPVEEGHYALNSRCYCHFTSPIRRYPDLTIHRLVDLLLHGKKSANDFVALLALGEHCSEREQRAESAERELIKLKLLTFFSQRIGMQLDAIVTGVQDYGLYAQGLQIPAEGLLQVRNLPADRYDYDERAHTLTGFRAGNQFRLGDLIRVEVGHVDLDRRELDWRYVRRIRRADAARGADAASDHVADQKQGRRKKSTRKSAKKKRSTRPSKGHSTTKRNKNRAKKRR